MFVCYIFQYPFASILEFDMSYSFSALGFEVSVIKCGQSLESSLCLCLQRWLVPLLTAIISFTEEQREAWRKAVKHGQGQGE